MEGRTMGEHSEVFVAFVTAKLKHAVAIAEAGRGGEIRFLGEVENQPATVERLIKKLGHRYRKLPAPRDGKGEYISIDRPLHDHLDRAPHYRRAVAAHRFAIAMELAHHCQRPFTPGCLRTSHRTGP